MATFLINYADGRFYESQQLNIKTGLEVAGFDRAIPLNRRSLDPVFCAENRDILSQPRGAGYWLWKVESIDEAVEWLKRCPNPMLVDSEIEIRPEFEAADFAK